MKKLCPQAWNELLKNAGLAGKVHMPISDYPDSEILALVSTAAGIARSSIPQIMETFGEFIASTL
jgi:hypothetical protein